MGTGALPIVAAAAPEVIPAAAKAAAPHVGKIARGVKAAANVAKGKVNDAAIATTGAIIRNQDTVNKAADVVMDLANPVPPAKTALGQAATGALYARDNIDYYNRKTTQKKEAKKLDSGANSWRGR